MVNACSLKFSILRVAFSGTKYIPFLVQPSVIPILQNFSPSQTETLCPLHSDSPTHVAPGTSILLCL